MPARAGLVHLGPLGQKGAVVEPSKSSGRRAQSGRSRHALVGGLEAERLAGVARCLSWRARGGGPPRHRPQQRRGTPTPRERPGRRPVARKRRNASEQCTLSEALSKATAGSSIDLASSGQGGVYVGNWTVSTPGTTSSAPLADPSGRGRQSAHTGRQPWLKPPAVGPRRATGQCSRSVQKYTSTSRASLSDMPTTPPPPGSAARSRTFMGATVTVSRSTFLDNYADANGGAIDNADITGTGTLIVSGSTFLGQLCRERRWRRYRQRRCGRPRERDRLGLYVFWQ